MRAVRYLRPGQVSRQLARSADFFADADNVITRQKFRRTYHLITRAARLGLPQQAFYPAEQNMSGLLGLRDFGTMGRRMPVRDLYRADIYGRWPSSAGSINDEPPGVGGLGNQSNTNQFGRSLRGNLRSVYCVTQASEGLSGLGRKPVKKMGYQQAQKQLALVQKRMGKHAGGPTAHQIAKQAALKNQIVARKPTYDARQAARVRPPNPPAGVYELGRVLNSDGTVTVTWSDGSTTVLGTAGQQQGTGIQNQIPFGGGGSGGGDGSTDDIYGGGDPSIYGIDPATGLPVAVDPSTGQPIQTAGFGGGSWVGLAVAGVAIYLLMKSSKGRSGSARSLVR